MLIRLVVGLGMTAIIALLALRRVLWLAKLTLSGQPVSGRTDDIGTRVWTQISEVFGQRRLLKWSIPGVAHFFTMWGFFILLTVYIEAYGVLFQPNFHIPLIGRWDVLGFLQDFFALAVLAGITTFAIIRLRSEPKEYGRQSRFYGSHTGGAWLILFMIFLVILSYAIFRGAAVEHRQLPLRQGRVLLPCHGRPAAPAGSHRQRVDRDVRADAAHRRHAGLPADRAALQAPAHLPGADQRHVQAAARRAWARCCRSSPTASRSTSKTRRRRRFRPRQDRGLHLEGHPRLRHLYRVRALPVAVPGLEHRQAAVAQARHHGPARPLDGQGALHPGREESGAARGSRPRDGQGRGPPRAGVRLRPGARARARAGRPPAGRHRRTGRRDRPRRAVVMRELRRLRRAVPGGHRAHRPHRRHAPLPGHDGVRVPLRAVGAVQKP